MRNLIVRSRNKSCAPLKELQFEKAVIYRMGSETPTNRILKKATRRQGYIELNTPEGCHISGDKILMKKRFNHARIHTAEWFTVKYTEDGKSACDKMRHYLNLWGTNIIAKHKHSSKGNGIYLIQTFEDFEQLWNLNPRDIVNYIFERYYTYSREYRLHVALDKGCFYTCRKMLINDAEDRWHRHGNNSTFIFEENPQFNKPENWDEIVEDCNNALKALGLVIAAFDVKVNKAGKFIILESNSAPALGETGIAKYKEMLTTLINERI